MFDLGMSHLIVVAIVGILVLGPEKLPGYIREAIRIWRTVRGLADDAQRRITSELLPDVSEEVRSMSPRRMVEHVLLGDDPSSSDRRPSSPFDRGAQPVKGATR